MKQACSSDQAPIAQSWSKLDRKAPQKDGEAAEGGQGVEDQASDKGERAREVERHRPLILSFLGSWA